MKNVIKDIPWSGSLIELDDTTLLEEWKAWNREYNGNYDSEALDKGKLICDKIREKYEINTLIQIGFLKDNHDKVGIKISNIPVGDIAYTPSKEAWNNNKVFATSIEKSKL
jgi:hypothetical protein